MIQDSRSRIDLATSRRRVSLRGGSPWDFVRGRIREEQGPSRDIYLPCYALKTRFYVALIILIHVVLAACGRASALDYPGANPGPATARTEGNLLRLESDLLSGTWELADGRLRPKALFDKRGPATIDTLGEAFRITLGDGRILSASDLRATGPARIEAVAANPKATCAAERCPGRRIAVDLSTPDGSLHAQWQAVLRDGANYVRQFVTLRAEEKEVAVRSIQLVDLSHPAARVAGGVAGSPVVAENWFFACEHPNGRNEVIQPHNPAGASPAAKGIACRLERNQAMRPNEPLAQSAVIGVAPPGQMRRAFLYYLERERPRPYRPFLHYNSWYDIAWGDRKMNEGQCLEVIEVFGRELMEKRKVPLDSLVFDDGWDDNHTLWRFHGGFPRGFTPLRAAAERHGSALGVWLSPWGGYGQAKAERMKYGRTQGFETNRNGFSLAGPRYYARFRDACAEMIDKYGVNYFKFDGVGQGNDSAGADPQYVADVQALLRLCGDLRQKRPDVYINITTGTWPSPFWLLWGDSIWRNGDDCGFFGQGSMRQQWITYRDMLTCQMVVRRGPLYPLNSLMVQGVCYARLGTATRMGNDLRDVVDEIRMLFAAGTQCQELYVTPQMMTPAMWDALAEAATWSRQNADVLVDAHWIGGDPGKAEPYGYASWSPRKGILALRNPGPQPARLTIDLQSALELPPGAPHRYVLRSPWKESASRGEIVLQSDTPHAFELAPWESLVLEAEPAP